VTTNIRRQLTLFVDPKDAKTIEQVRQQFNPKQFELIKSHVTLCREDEIQNLEHIIRNLHSLTAQEIVIEFGKAIRFDNGNGLFLPASTNNAGFHALRRQALCGLNYSVSNHEPHITLMHPRNSTCTDEIFQKIEKVILPTQLKFKIISLIEQEDGGQWKILQEFELRERT
jgi:2'-5' RNA ligase